MVVLLGSWITIQVVSVKFPRASAPVRGGDSLNHFVSALSLSLCLSIYQSLCLSLSLSMSNYLSVSLYISIHLSLSPSLSLFYFFFLFLIRFLVYLFMSTLSASFFICVGFLFVSLFDNEFLFFFPY